MWHIIRVAYFESTKTSILLGPIKESVEGIQKQFGVPVFITSHWKFGPHIDIAVGCESQLFETDIFPKYKALISGWLAENPSAVELDEEEYGKLSIKLALSELENPPYLPLLENNSVTVAPYVPSKLINIEQFHSSKESFLAESTSVLFELASLNSANRNMFFVNLVFMMTILARKFKTYGVQRGYISFRSHAEYFLENFDKTGQIRNKYNALDQTYSSVIDAHIEKISECDFDGSDLDDSLKSILRSWVEVVDKIFEQNVSIANENYDQIYEGDSERSSMDENLLDLAKSISDQVADDQNKPSTDFNAGKVVNSAISHQEGRDLFSSPDFIAYRITVNYFYLLLPILDVSPMQKFSLCHIFANTVERVYGINWKDVIPTEKEAT